MGAFFVQAASVHKPFLSVFGSIVAAFGFGLALDLRLGTGANIPDPLLDALLCTIEGRLPFGDMFCFSRPRPGIGGLAFSLSVFGEVDLKANDFGDCDPDFFSS